MGFSEWIAERDAIIAIIGWVLYEVLHVLSYFPSITSLVGGDQCESTITVGRVDGPVVLAGGCDGEEDPLKRGIVKAVFVGQGVWKRSKNRGELLNDNIYFLKKSENPGPISREEDLRFSVYKTRNCEHLISLTMLKEGDQFRVLPPVSWLFFLLSRDLGLFGLAMQDLGVYAATRTCKLDEIVVGLTIFVITYSLIDLILTVYTCDIDEPDAEFLFHNLVDAKVEYFGTSATIVAVNPNSDPPTFVLADESDTQIAQNAPFRDLRFKDPSINTENIWLKHLKDYKVVTKDADLEEYSVEATNIYEDMGCQVRAYVLRFMGQGMLMAMVAGTLAFPDEEKEGETEPDSYAILEGMTRPQVFFACSIVIQLMAVTQVSTPFWQRWFWWVSMLKTRSELCTEFHRCVSMGYDGDKNSVEYDRRDRSDLRHRYVLPRFIMSFLVNAIFMELIFAYTPLVLMGAESALDFAKDTFAIAFIVTLDDLSEPKKLYIPEPSSFKRNHWRRKPKPKRAIEIEMEWTDAQSKPKRAMEGRAIEISQITQDDSQRARSDTDIDSLAQMAVSELDLVVEENDSPTGIGRKLS